MIDEVRLRQLYITERRSIRDIAALERVSTRMIYDALIHYHIPRRPAGFRPKNPQPAQSPLNEATLRRLYLQEQRSIRDIAALQQVSTRTVYDALSHYSIPRRPAGQPRQSTPSMITLGNRVLDKPTLQRLYEEDGQSIAAIAASLSCPPSRIRSALVRWGIERRRRGRQYGPISEQEPGKQPG
jgi:predicted DNA-binding protein YlxM (UPF0122 family)